ncbi:hypothetical protein TTHERM_000095443 (macronuclear) [Tetrahymena thermophila SB210]|uniref:Uncharacterized protein n=1 Tax=Tetrahymena thermophila (strain SB210) TaxID=312017 RepID=W7XD11_TETTS|nr:hypothetical protein TTHERM_000095443 [Tetrahymena thermophila SB210]EWS75367.1 hypothetical protein TTHERM_000095443 [Tetrahymena thermophila SB210]|eukprot:XP_012652041.1 hypothetical protein TTHERM_000095443 [Tetrahymena thermophila SB210]
MPFSSQTQSLSSSQEQLFKESFLDAFETLPLLRFYGKSVVLSQEYMAQENKKRLRQYLQSLKSNSQLLLFLFAQIPNSVQERKVNPILRSQSKEIE